MLGREGLGNSCEMANPLSLVAISASSARCIAGPVNIHDDVLRAMNVQSQNHRDAWFAPFFKYVRDRWSVCCFVKRGQEGLCVVVVGWAA